MPYFSIRTNQPVESAAASELTRRMSTLAADLLGKPETYVMTTLFLFELGRASGEEPLA